MFDADKTSDWAGVYMVKKNYDNMLSRFHPITERYGRTDRQIFAVSISCVSVLTRDKNLNGIFKHQVS